MVAPRAPSRPDPSDTERATGLEAAPEGGAGSPARNGAGAIPNAFSVDVEDYFQVAAFEGLVPRSEWDGLESRVESNTRRLLDLLDGHRVRATFFVLGWVAERHPRLVREIERRGHEVAAHGYDHRPVTSQSRDEFRADVRKTKRILEDLSGVEVLGYRAPTYSIVRGTLWALDVLAEEGYRYDSSIFPIVHDRYGIPTAERFPGPLETRSGRRLLEFPISTVRLGGINFPFVGGGYLRQYPLWVILRGMRRVNLVDRQPALVYVHPWELDPEQPRLPAGALTRLRHYRNLHRTEDRLRALLSRFRFTTLRSVLGL